MWSLYTILFYILAPYWVQKLSKNNLTAHQPSTRGGVLILELNHDDGTLAISGQAAIVCGGEMIVA